MNVSGQLRSGGGVYFQSSLTFKQFEIFFEFLQANAQYIDVLFVKKLTDIKCLDKKVNRKLHVIFYHPTYIYKTSL